MRGGLAARAEEVPEGLDLGVSRMKSGEKAELTVSPAYGFKDQVARPALWSRTVLPCGHIRRSWVLLKDRVARGALCLGAAPPCGRTRRLWIVHMSAEPALVRAGVRCQPARRSRQHACFEAALRHLQRLSSSAANS